jgi:GT2 family glycosyltransferase
MNLGFVFTSYNNTPFTQELLNSLAHVQGVENCRVVVVDNNSDEKNRDELISACSNIPYVSLILNDENVGYFKGLNIGIRQLRATLADCNCVVIGNNDLIFSPDFVESIFRNEAIFNHPVIAPDIVTANGVHQNPHVIKKIGWFRELFYDLYHLNYHLSKVITFASNCFPVAKRRDHDFYHLGRGDSPRIWCLLYSWSNIL